MASLNLSTNGPSIKKSYQSIVDGPAPSANSPTYAQWALYSVQAPLTSAFQQDSSKESVLKVQTTGEGELHELLEDFSDGRIQFAFAKLKDPNSGLPKSVLISWCGEGVPERTKGYFNTHRAAVSKLLHGYHVEITARSDSHLSPESIIEKVSNASGAKYGGGPSTSDSSASRGPPAPVATKPVFMPTRTGGSLLASRPKPAAPTSTDGDGWGEDAPQLSRNTLQKVESAYKPTKVNMAELTSQKQQPSRFQPPTRQENDGPSDVVRGGYQPIGKVDINAIRSQAREQKDDRPTIVKGAYEPVGKVDIAAIRAKAQPSASSAAPPVSQSRTGDDEEQAPRSLADRSAAFSQSSQSGRMSEMPKPKVANRFGSSTSSFAGTKAPTPVGFGVPPPAASAPIGAASKNFGSTDGKSPAQLWAEKKARERGLSGAADTAPPPAAAVVSPMQSQPSGGWQSGYAGKSWAPVSTDRTGTSNISAQKTGQDDVRSPERETEPELPSGGVGTLKDRFKNAAPMGASNTSDDSPARSMPPPMDFSSKPNAGSAGRFVPLPPPQEEEDYDRPEEEHVSLPPPPQQPRSPTPSPPSSPIRVAMPVARSAPVEPMEAPEERFVAPPMPTQSLSNAASAAAAHMRDEPEDEEDHARAAAEEASATTFGASAAANANPGAGIAGKRALVQYDYEKAEDNEIELHEGEYVENIEMVDEDWWMGQNSQGETGLFPSNYVELVEDDDATAGGAAPPPPAPARDEPAAHAAPTSAASGGQTATAQYDYEAAEDNELSFPDGAKITDVEFPDEDWWFGHYNGEEGLFPANYVELDQ